MKKVIWILMLLVVVLSSYTSGLDCYVSNDVNYSYSFDVNSDDDLGSGRDWIEQHAPPRSATYGLLGAGYDFDGTNDYLSNATIPNPSGGLGYTISIWVNSDVDGSAMDFLIINEDSYTYMWKEANDELTLWVRDVATATHEIAPVGKYIKAAGGWYHIAVVWNNSDNSIKLYLNDTVIGTSSTADFQDNNFNDGIAQGFGAVGDWNGQIDELRFWYRPLPPLEITGIYNNKLGCNPLNSTPTNLSTITLNYPTNKTHYNLNNIDITKRYNGSIIATTDLAANCSMNNTNWTVSSTGSTTHLFLNNTPILEDNYSITINCSRLGTTIYTSFWFVVDTTPIIHSTTIVNNTVYNSSFWLNVTYFDTYLYRTNTTLIHDSTGVTYYNNYSGDLSGADVWYNVTKFINVSNFSFPVGNYTIYFDATDTHTDNDYFVDEKIINVVSVVDKERINEFLFKEHKFIIKTPETVVLGYKQLSDRLTFSYKSSIIGETYKIIEGEKSVVYLKDSPFNYHFIIDDKLWYDNVGLDVTRIERLDEKSYKIYYNQNKETEESRSLGGLNELSVTYNIRIVHGISGIIPIGTVFNPSDVNFFYNTTVVINTTLAYVNETCLVIVDGDYAGTYCYSLNSLYLDDVVIFYGATPVGCNANITDSVGSVINTDYEFLNRTNATISSGDTPTCEHNVVCDVGTLQPNYIIYNDTISCRINVTESFFYFQSNATNGTDTNSINICDTAHPFQLVNISYLDEVDDSAVTTTMGYDIKFYDGLGYFNLTGNFSPDINNQYCTDLNGTITGVNLDMYGDFTLTAPSYVTRIVNLPLVQAIGVSNNPATLHDFLMIRVSNSSTITYTWQTTEFQFITGTMIINQCELDGSKVLVEATPITAGQATANLQLFSTPYSYSVVIDGVTYIDDSFTTCHIESVTDREFFVDVSALNILPTIGLFLVDCHMTKVADNIVKMVWSGNIEDTSDITGCIIGSRQTITGIDEIYRNCTTGVTGSFTRTIPDNGNAYYVTGEITQSGTTGFCRGTVSFFDDNDASIVFGASALLGVVILILSLGLIYAGEGEKQLIGAGVGLVIAFVLGLVSLSWEIVFSLVVFLVIVAIVGRYSRMKQEQ